jgi:hypothetical protein
MRGSVTINPRGSNTSSNSGGVGNYLDLPDRPDELIEETVVPAVSAGEFIPNSDNGYKLGVTIADNGGTIRSSTSGDGWGKSGTFSDDFLHGDGYVSAKAFVNTATKYYVFGLSYKDSESDATSRNRNTIDYMIYMHARTIIIQENGTAKGSNTYPYDFNSTYKVQRTGTVVTYLKDDVVFYTSTVPSPAGSDLYLDVSFWSSDVGFKDIKMLDSLKVATPETVKYTLDLKNPNVM